MAHNLKAIKVTIEIDECGHATVEKCFYGRMYKVNDYPYKFRNILIKDILEMIEEREMTEGR